LVISWSTRSIGRASRQIALTANVAIATNNVVRAMSVFLQVFPPATESFASGVSSQKPEAPARGGVLLSRASGFDRSQLRAVSWRGTAARCGRRADFGSLQAISSVPGHIAEGNNGLIKERGDE
jgi:hypothetical protein